MKKDITKQARAYIKRFGKDAPQGSNRTASHFAQATIQLAAALTWLMSDTQHADHNCGDDVCPVDNARETLKHWGIKQY